MDNINLKRNPSIANIGLQKFLDDTKDKHRGMGYDTFVSLVGPDPKLPLVAKRSMARAFGVSHQTIYNWLEFYAKEQV